MSFLQSSKRLLFRGAEIAGVSSLFLSSKWRRSRLLILCYHGISLADEHEWNPGLYITADRFRKRLQNLKDRDCTVLGLGEAVERLYSNALPPRSVVLTFDDGFYDFYSLAWPILKQFEWPATVYLTTYYSQFESPVFDPMCSYLIWKSPKSALDWPKISPNHIPLDTGGRTKFELAVKEYCCRQGLSGREKFDLLVELGARLDVDVPGLSQARILHIMKPDEVSKIASEGADVQLHMHRHRVSRNRERFWQEIDENRDCIRELTGKEPVHFCYPGGFWLREFPDWLRQRRVVSATTCDVGMATPADDPFYLPRVLDTNLEQEVFDSWVCGVADIVSRHSVNKSEGQLLE